MSHLVRLLAIYLHLAAAGARRRRPHARDRFLTLAAALAVDARLPRVAAYCRRLILQHNPRHVIGRSPSVVAARSDSDFQHVLVQLMRRYPPERAEQMLASLNIDLAEERAAYYSSEEYAAALLGTSPAELEQLFGPGDLPDSAG